MRWSCFPRPTRHGPLARSWRRAHGRPGHDVFPVVGTDLLAFEPEFLLFERVTLETFVVGLRVHGLPVDLERDVVLRAPSSRGRGFLRDRQVELSEPLVDLTHQLLRFAFGFGPLRSVLQRRQLRLHTFPHDRLGHRFALFAQLVFLLQRREDVLRPRRGLSRVRAGLSGAGYLAGSPTGSCPSPSSGFSPARRRTHPSPATARSTPAGRSFWSTSSSGSHSRPWIRSRAGLPRFCRSARPRPALAVPRDLSRAARQRVDAPPPTRAHRIALRDPRDGRSWAATPAFSSPIPARVSPNAAL